jgi:hypothetical protein
MVITFDGVVLARERQDGGTDGVMGFDPAGKQRVQIAEFIRALDAVPYARGNRIHTLKGTIMPAVFPSPGAAMADLLTRYSGLPQSGILQFEQDGFSVQFANAVLESFESQRDGCSYTVDISFQASVVSKITYPPPIITDAGQVLGTDDGNAITPDPS